MRSNLKLDSYEVFLAGLATGYMHGSPNKEHILRANHEASSHPDPNVDRYLREKDALLTGDKQVFVARSEN